MNFGDNYINIGEAGVNNVPINTIKEKADELRAVSRGTALGNYDGRGVNPTQVKINKGVTNELIEQGKSIQPMELGYEPGKVETLKEEGKSIQPNITGVEEGIHKGQENTGSGQPDVRRVEEQRTDQELVDREVMKDREEEVNKELMEMSLSKIRIIIGDIPAEKMMKFLVNENEEIFKNLGNSTKEEVESFLTTIKWGLESGRYEGTADVVLNNALTEGGPIYNQATVIIIKHLYKAVRMAEMEGE